MTEESQAKVFWQQVPSVFSDGVLASASAGGIHRIVLGEFVFDPAENASEPALKPVATLVMSVAGIKNLIAYLGNMEGVKE